MEGYWPENDIDHINRVKTDNRWSNLREVSKSCNMRNRSLLKNNKSGITGVRWRCKHKKWIAQAKIGHKHIHLGNFSTKLEAAKARWDAEVEYNFSNCYSDSTAYLYLKKHGKLDKEGEE